MGREISSATAANITPQNEVIKGCGTDQLGISWEHRHAI
jgi:hypothetical protein